MSKKMYPTHYVYTRLEIPENEASAIGYRFTFYRVQDTTNQGRTVYRVNVKNALDGSQGTKWFDTEDDAVDAILNFKFDSHTWNLY